jgi:uncharacterized protein
MELKGEAKLVRIFVGSSDLAGNTPLYEHIVFAAKKQGLAGVTVLKGVMGFGASSFIHTAKVLAISEDLPMVIEIVDEASKIDAFIPTLSKYFDESKWGGIITTEKVNVLAYSSAKKTHP